MKSKRLRPDGSYSANGNLICAYSETGHQRKEQFLRDAAALLRETAKHLARHGWVQSDIRRNHAGIAVSGEATADFWDPDTRRGVWVEIGSTCLSSLSGRRDGVAILARWRTYKDEPARGHKAKQLPTPQTEGPNQWLSPEADSQALAKALLAILNGQRAPIGSVTTPSTQQS